MKRIVTAREQAEMLSPWHITAGKRGELPGDITFSHRKLYDGRDAVQAHIGGDTHIGQLQWDSRNAKRGFPNDINYITVHPEYRRRGIGTAMYNYAVQNVDPDLLPGSDNVTPSGMGFSKSLGFKPSPYADGTRGRFDKQPVRDDGCDWPDAKIGNGQTWDDKFWRGKSKDRFACRLWRGAALSPEDWVSVAEQSMERAGHGGHQFNIPTATFDKARERGYSDKYGQPDARRLQREYSQESEDYVNNILAEQGWDLAQKGHRVRVEPEHWDLRNGGQAVTDGCNYIGIKGNDTNSLALLHETAHILSKTPHAPGGHGPDFQKIVHGLYHNYLNPEAADIFSGIVSPSGRTSAKPRRFNQDWQVIGGDYFPLDVISHYMDRKGEGFGDEKAPLYEMNGKPPLSQQITEDGYEKPVELCTDGRSGRVYDGHHRIDVARQLGHTHVPVQVSWRNSSGYGNEGAYGNKIEPWLKGWLTDMRRGRETTGALHIRADMSDQPDDVTDDYTLAEFFQWCAHNRYKPNQVALDQYAQVSGMDLQDYQDLSNFLDGMELGGDGFLDKTSRYLRNPKA